MGMNTRREGNLAIRKLLSAILIIGVFNIATPSHLRASDSHSAETPLQPAWPHIVAGSGAYASVEPMFKDRAEWELLDIGTEAFKVIGWNQAATQMQRYLANSGEMLYVDPLQMLSALPEWRAQVESQVLKMLQQASHASKDASTVISGVNVIQSEWLPARATRQENPDWYFALGSFSYKLVLTLETESPVVADQANVVHVGLTVYVYDRYDWDDGRGTSIAGLYFANELIGQLHRAGLARDYDVKGTATLNFATVLRQGCDTCATFPY